MKVTLCCFGTMRNRFCIISEALLRYWVLTTASTPSTAFLAHPSPGGFNHYEQSGQSLEVLPYGLVGFRGIILFSRTIIGLPNFSAPPSGLRCSMLVALPCFIPNALSVSARIQHPISGANSTRFGFHLLF